MNSNDDLERLMALYKEVSDESGAKVYLEPEKRNFYQQAVENVFDDISPYPPETLYLGTVLSDGLPLLLNMEDNIPSSVLITAPENHGAKDLFKASIYMTSENLAGHSSFQISLAVITAGNKSFYEMEGSNVDIAYFHERKADDLILSLAAWAHSNRRKKYAILFFDCFDLWEEMEFDTRQNLRWLLINGHKRGVRIVAHATRPTELDDLFNVKITNKGLAEVEELKPEHYGIHVGFERLIFWSPKID